MRNCTVGNLGPDQDVHQRSRAEKPSQTLDCSPAIEGSVTDLLFDLAAAQVNTDRNQCQPAKEKDRENKKKHNPDIGILDVTANLRGQDKEPRHPSRRDQSHAD